MAKTNRDSAKRRWTLQDGLSSADSDAGRFIARVIAMVHMSDYVGTSGKGGVAGLTIESFIELRKLAALDAFSGCNDAAKGDLLGGLTARTVRRRRKHAAYKIIHANCLEAAADLGGFSTMSQASEKLERTLVEKVIDRALEGDGTRDQLAAINEFTARQSAKKTRETAQSAALLLPSSFIKQLVSAARADDVVVDAEFEEIQADRAPQLKAARDDDHPSGE